MTMQAHLGKSRAWLLAGLLSLASCAPSASYWSEAQSPKRNGVEPVRLLHDLRVPPSGDLGPAETTALEAFLARHEVGDGDAVTVIGAGGATLRERLRRQGIDAEMAAASDLPAGSLRLQVDRYVVLPPNCPDWRKPATSDYGNGPMSNLGCANAVNLGLMLADPRDLIQGRQPGAADGTASAAAIQRYRADKVRPLAKGNTTE